MEKKPIPVYITSPQILRVDVVKESSKDYYRLSLLIGFFLGAMVMFFSGLFKGDALNMIIGMLVLQTTIIIIK